MYENPKDHPPGAAGSKQERHTGEGESERAAMARAGSFDRTLQHPRCVFQILKRHYQRYTPEMVEEICGMPPETFRKIAETLCDNSGRERTGAICYAVGWTHHLTGPQIIRAASIVQTLLGNIGRPGGGILALRGHASIQGSTDIPTLYNMLPGYITMPRAKQDSSFEGVLRPRDCPIRVVGRIQEVPGVAAQSMVGRRGDRSERLVLRLPASHRLATIRT